MPSAEGGHYLRKVSFNASNLRLFRSSPLSLPFVRLPCGLKAVRTPQRRSNDQFRWGSTR
ncbi:MAG: hypothetical protein ACTS42_01160 [Candidatus Hodgkinia cicadicola]